MTFCNENSLSELSCGIHPFRCSTLANPYPPFILVQVLTNSMLRRVHCSNPDRWGLLFSTPTFYYVVIIPKKDHSRSISKIV